MQEDRKDREVHGEPWVYLDHQELMYATCIIIIIVNMSDEHAAYS